MTWDEEVEVGLGERHVLDVTELWYEGSAFVFEAVEMSSPNRLDVRKLKPD
jgi:hypothetical protein